MEVKFHAGQTCRVGHCQASVASLVNNGRMVLSLLRRPAEWPMRSPDGRILVRPMRSYDLAEVAKWMDDPQSLRLAFGTEQSDEQVLALGRIYLAEMDSARANMLAVCDPLERLLGFVRFSLFQHEGVRNARIGIMLGRRDDRHRGVGSAATQLALQFLFERKGCRRVELDTAEFNGPAQGCFRKCGFEVIPRERRQSWMTESSDPTPKVWMELRREHWRRLYSPA